MATGYNFQAYIDVYIRVIKDLYMACNQQQQQVKFRSDILILSVSKEVPLYYSVLLFCFEMARVGGFSNSDNTIYLNVYDLHVNNYILYQWGLGFYHSGVQIGRNEYTFAGEAGIFFHEPRGAPPPAKFRESIALGTFKGTTRDLEAIIQSLRSKFSGSDYHILNNNCNSFANELCLRLLGKEIPGYVNRMANIGSYFSCLLPENATGSLVNDPSASTSAGANTGFYSKPGRLASHSAGASSALHENKGVKLGGSGSADVVIEDHRERRERIRQAATKRFSSSSDSSSAQL